MDNVSRCDKRMALEMTCRVGIVNAGGGSRENHAKVHDK
jgi:hypothetical protein